MAINDHNPVDVQPYLDLPGFGGDVSSFPGPHEISNTSASEDHPAAPGRDEFERYKQCILDDFRNWLDRFGEREFRDLQTSMRDAADEPDLESFFRELVALRREVRLQAKTSNEVNQEISRLTDSLETDLKQHAQDLSYAVRDVKSQIPEARRQAVTDVAMEYIDIVECIERCAGPVTEVSVPAFLFRRGSRQKFLDDLRKPREMLLAKAREGMRRLKIAPVAQVGVEFDAKHMRAVGVTERTPGARPGTVTEVCLQGYMLANALIRTAEVKVEK